MIVVTYTTRYRRGGSLLARAARTLAAERRAAGHRVHLAATETKRAFVEAVQGAPEPVTEIHFLGHSGMYGPMFGTTDLPEQFSPHEWRTLDLPLADDAVASFHACRTGRWFAPFFARTFGITAQGHRWYTTFSRAPDRYRRVTDPTGDRPVYVIGQPGRTSHGWLGALGKHTGLLPPEPLLTFSPQPHEGADYDRVAHLYDRVFDDIRVRDREWRWIAPRIPRGARVLDLGCGTGALLRALEGHGIDGVGADVSGAMLDRARARRPERAFVRLDGPTLPFPDGRFDIVVSLLSWRYLDWDPILAEIARVLRPGGRLLVVDMVAKAARLRETPRVLADALHARRIGYRYPDYIESRDTLTSDPAWAEMLRYNPIRAEHEYRWFFQSRFSDSTFEILDVGRHSRIVAVDTGPVTTTWFPPQSYP